MFGLIKQKIKTNMALLAENFIKNAQFDWLFQNSGLRMPPTKIGQVDPESRLSIARRMALGLPRML